MKYGNHRFTDEDGNKWDSKREFHRWLLLLDMQDQGAITNLRRQVKFELLPTMKKGGKFMRTERGVYYVADFTYYQNGELVVEDSKGMRTPDYIIKRKMMRALKGIEIMEV